MNIMIVKTHVIAHPVLFSCCFNSHSSYKDENVARKYPKTWTISFVKPNNLRMNEYGSTKEKTSVVNQDFEEIELETIQ